MLRSTSISWINTHKIHHLSKISIEGGKQIISIENSNIFWQFSFLLFSSFAAIRICNFCLCCCCCRRYGFVVFEFFILLRAILLLLDWSMIDFIGWIADGKYKNRKIHAKNKFVIRNNKNKMRLIKLRLKTSVRWNKMYADPMENAT